jgi:hypothetical protein
MRKSFCVLLLALVGLILTGCSTGPGLSPDQIAANYNTPGYLDRDFHSIQPDVP